MDEIDAVAQILRDARDQGHIIYVNACVKYIKKMNPLGETQHA